MFYVYVLRSEKDKQLYFGYTNDLKRRVEEHTKGLNTSTRYRLPMKLVYYEAYVSQADAKDRERMLKTSSGAHTALKRRIMRCLR